MRRLSKRQLAMLNGIVLELHHRGTEPTGVKDAFLAVLERVVPNEIATVDEVMADGSVHVHQRPFTPGVIEVLPVLAAHLQEHPNIPWFIRRDPTPVKISDHLSLNLYRRKALYNEVYRQFNVKYQMNVMPPGTELKNSCITLHRRHRDFTEEDRQSLALLSPHFSVAYHNAVALAQSQRDRAMLTRALAAQNQEVVFLDETGAPCSLSARVQQWFSGYLPAASGSAGLPEPIRQWMRQSLIALQVQHTVSGPVPPLRVSGPEGQLEVRLFADPTGRRMLLLTEKRSIFAPDRLASLGFTLRETEVFRWVAEGKTDEEIGLILGMSRHTAHKHAQNIYAKLNVSNRAAALLRVCESLGNG